MNPYTLSFQISRIWSIFLLLSVSSIALSAQLSLPSFFSDNMVLQRDKPIKIWGNAEPGAAINIRLHTQLNLAIADENGYWEGILGALPFGGPYQMIITNGEEQVQFSNIMMGEVWVCAGQSNMERPLKVLPNISNEIASANWPNIRYFKTPDVMKAQPNREMMTSSWTICTPETAKDYSGTAYYFARDLHLDLNIPIGIIDITWGGTKIDTWISLESLSSFPEFANTLPPLNIDQLAADITQEQDNWDEELETTDIGLQQHWESNSYNWESWPTMLLPKPWEADILGDTDGSVWFKKTFELSASQANNDVTVSLGKIDDSDQSWINGQFIGSLERDPGTVRQYNVPSSFLQNGQNTVTVRVRDYGFVGGMLGGSNDMKIEGGMWQTSLVGYWSFLEGTPNLGERPRSLIPNDYPSLLFNGMISPFLGLQIAGVAWYQGESDSGDPFYYRNKQIKLIDDWRSNWSIGDFPFIITQLPFFRQTSGPSEQSSWATLRESQTFALKRANTALVCLIDTGDPFNIHPPQKFIVGTRLARAAKRLVYQQNIVASGPKFHSAVLNESTVNIFFKTYGSSLQSNNGNTALSGFAIAGEDGQFVWANAEILNGQTVVVSHPSVPTPKYVRYAWADNPGTLNLFNTEGLPAIPFRTDELPTPWE